MKIDMRKYINVLCEMLGIEEPTIHLGLLPQDNHVLSKTYMDNENKMHVYVNDKLDTIQTWIVLAHELRHCYQLNCVYNGVGDEKQSLLDQWRKEFSSYTDSRTDTYFDQDVETDAIVFSMFVMYYAFGVEVFANHQYDENVITGRINSFVAKYGTERLEHLKELVILD